MPVPLESVYRDFLAEKLDLIEPGLELVSAEMLLPNNQGARGFVDLVARDRFGVLVLVELKRSDSAARSAMHELFKYVALFRKDHGLATHQVRCILLSTVWHELLVPFSELLASAPFEVSGRELVIGQGGRPSETREVLPIDGSNAISICPTHEVLLYHSPDERAADIERVKAAMYGAGVADYYLIHMDHDRTDPRVITPYALYLVLGELSAVQRAEVQATRDRLWREDAVGDDYDVPEPGDEDYEEMDAASWDHEAEVFTWLNKATNKATVEIGYPDKFRQTLPAWPAVEFTRSGRFASELVWPNDALIAGAMSEGGEHTTVFISQVSTANKTAVTRMLANINYSLMGVKGWRKQVPRLLSHLCTETSASSISVDLFSPCDLLWGISALPEGKTGYLPGFEIVAESIDGGPRIFVGALEWDQETRPSTSMEIDDLVDGGPMDYVLSRQLGTQWQDEERYCRFHGLRYAIYEVGLESGEQRFWRMQVKSSAIKRQEITLGQLQAGSIYAFAKSNGPYLEHLSFQLIKAHTLGSPF